MELTESFIEIRGNREVLVDGFTRLLDYRDDEIRLMTAKKELLISGDTLKMDMMTDGKMAVSGSIRSVSFKDIGGGAE